MTHPTLDRTRRAFYGLVGVLAAFIIIADILIIGLTRHELIKQSDAHSHRESLLFTKLVTEALNKGAYSSVEQAVRSWGRDDPDIISIRIAMANGFVLAAYSRDHEAPATRGYQKTFSYGNGGTATIDILKDVTGIRTHIIKQSAVMVVFSVVLALLMIYFLRQEALRPLQEETREHRRTAESLAIKSEALTRSNHELEAFSYSVAHDLRAPLRAIISFSQILREEIADKLDDENRSHLQRVIDAGTHMSNLIDSLLGMARISRTSMEVQTVDISQLSESFLDQLRQTYPDRQVRYTVTPDLVAQADPGLLELVIENLLENAWKYTATIDDPHIEVGTTLHNGKPVFFVRDNGIGFDMKYAGKLFQPFQRLETSPLFKGTGIGLANVKRIIERHGGTVWADAMPGKGASFYFTLSALQ